MRATSRRLRRDRTGVASIEFAAFGATAVAAIVFILVGGLVIWTKSAMHVAAAQTARCVAVQSKQCPNANSYAQDILTKWGVAAFVGTSPTVNVNPSDNACNTSGVSFTSVTITGASDGIQSLMVAPLLNWSNISLTSMACYPNSG